MFFKFCCFAAFAVLLCTGCDSSLKLVPVTGTVTVDGTPLALKSLMFYPEGDTPGVGGGGNTQKDGTYQVIATMPGATTDQIGLPPGKYRVIVFEPMFPIKDDLQVQSSDAEESVIAVAPEFGPRKRTIPAIYTRQETTPLVLDIPEEGGVFDLKLSSKGG